MKRHFNDTAGVTLLEIMLVLAISSMIIVMSIRYYQNVNNATNTNVILDQFQNIQAAADLFAQNTGSYSTLTESNLKTIAGSKNLTTPYNSSYTITGTSATVYTIEIGSLPQQVCENVKARLAANTKFVGVTCSNGVVKAKYDLTEAATA